MKSGFIQISWW